MHRTLVLATLIVIFLFVVFLFLSYISPFSARSPFLDLSAPPGAKLYFEPDIIYSSCNNSSHNATLYLSSGFNTILSAQIELSFGPPVYEVMLSPAPDNFFGDNGDYLVKLQEVREQYGRASLALKINPNQIEKRGEKPVAKLSFKTFSAVSSGSAQITFLNKTAVYSSESEESLLKETLPLKIICTR